MVKSVLLAFFVLFFCVIIMCVFRKKNKTLHSRNYIDPMTFFTGGLFVYSIVGAFDWKQIESTTSLTIYVLTILLGYIAFSFGYLISVREEYSFDSRYKKISFSMKAGIIEGKTVQVVDCLMILLLLLLIITNRNSFIQLFTKFGSGNSYVDSAIRADRTAFSGAQSLMESFFGLFMIAFPTYRIYKTSKITLIDLAVLLAYAVFSLASGYRSELVTIGIAVLVIINYRVKRLSFKELAIMGVTALLLLVSVGHLRRFSNIGQMIQMLKTEGLSLFRLGSSGEFSNTTVTFFSYINAIKNGTRQFDIGLSWLTDIAMFIPTFLWRSRPLPLAEQYMKEFFPNAPEGTGHGWFVMNTGYMAFGIIGVIIELFVLGVVLAKVFNFFMKRKEDSLIMTMYVYLLLFVFTLARGSFIGAVKNYLLQVLPLIIVYYVSHHIKVGRKI